MLAWKNIEVIAKKTAVSLFIVIYVHMDVGKNRIRRCWRGGILKISLEPKTYRSPEPLMSAQEQKYTCIYDVLVGA